MAKYIRTKEGNIYQRFFKDKSIRGVGGGGCCDQNLNPIGETVIKESDNLEELCDEFVVNEYDNTTIHHVRYLLVDAKNIFNNEKDLYPDLKIELYGAIWTDKGLIYVAKMNEKGELELL